MGCLLNNLTEVGIVFPLNEWFLPACKVTKFDHGSDNKQASYDTIDPLILVKKSNYETHH